jgi:hypothetical protein
MNMKSFIAFILWCLLSSSTTLAGIVLGAYGGRSSDSGKGIEKLKGPIIGGKIGFRYNWLALEFAHTNYNLEAEKGQAEGYFIQKAEVKGRINDLMLRFYPFSFISLVGGYSQVKFDADVQLTNINGDPSSNLSEKGSTLYDRGHFLGGAIHVPLGAGVELFGEYIQRRVTSSFAETLGSDFPDLKLNEWHAGITWTWGGEISKKKKKSNPEGERFIF